MDRDPLAPRARRPRPELAAHARVRGALRLPLAAAVGLPAVGQDDRQRAAALRHARASGAPRSRDRDRKIAVLPGLLRARRRLGSRLAAHQSTPGRRPVRRQRPQDLDLERRLRAVGLPRGAHRPRPRAPPRRLGARRRHHDPRDHRQARTKRSAAERSASSSSTRSRSRPSSWSASCTAAGGC